MVTTTTRKTTTRRVSLRMGLLMGLLMVGCQTGRPAQGARAGLPTSGEDSTEGQSRLDPRSDSRPYEDREAEVRAEREAWYGE